VFELFVTILIGNKKCNRSYMQLQQRNSFFSQVAQAKQSLLWSVPRELWAMAVKNQV